MEAAATPTPPRHGEGDRAKKSRGGGVFAASATAKATARQERRSGNLPEVLLWRELRKRPGGHKFRRQHPIATFSLDFACLVVRIAIEIDGSAHDHGDRPKRDEERDRQLTQLGFRTLRFSARDVLNDLDAVIRAIVSACDDALPLHRPSDGPPPRSGEVFAKDIA